MSTKIIPFALFLILLPLTAPAGGDHRSFVEPKLDGESTAEPAATESQVYWKGNDDNHYKSTMLSESDFKEQSKGQTVIYYQFNEEGKWVLAEEGDNGAQAWFKDGGGNWYGKKPSEEKSPLPSGLRPVQTFSVMASSKKSVVSTAADGTYPSDALYRVESTTSPKWNTENWAVTGPTKFKDTKGTVEYWKVKEDGSGYEKVEPEGENAQKWKFDGKNWVGEWQANNQGYGWNPGAGLEYKKQK